MTSNDSLLAVRDLRVWFSLRRTLVEFFARRPGKYVRAVDGVTFDVGEGETFCVVGESGCGKSTLGRAVLGLVPITSGSVLYKPTEKILNELSRSGAPIVNERVNMAVIRSEAARILRRELQLIHQDPFASLNPRFTIGDIVEEPLRAHFPDMDPAERRERALRALESVKLSPAEEIARRYPHQLSGGQRQRVAIARALVIEPKLVVADEPVSMLDVSIRAEILELMLSLKNRLGLTYIFITHDLAVARYVCDKIAVMYLGKIVELGKPGEIIEAPLHPYARALVAAVPEPDPSNRLRQRPLPVKGEVPSPINVPRGCRFHPRCVALDENRERLRGLCEMEEPPLIEVEPGRFVACWLYSRPASSSVSQAS
ncbi:MAG: ABC transporter ATP-binding protein [Fervidicoccaceae archaeon]